MNQKIAGFTLMELMITLAIIAIIATVAMPNYSRYVQRGDRSDAIASMHAIMQPKNVIMVIMFLTPMI